MKTIEVTEDAFTLLEEGKQEEGMTHSDVINCMEHLIGRLIEENHKLKKNTKNVAFDVGELDVYPAWDLSKNEQPYGDGVVDVIYSCRVLKDGEWTNPDYGSTPELAFKRTLVEDED